MAGVYDPGLERIRSKRRLAEAIAGNAVSPALQAGPQSLQYVGPAGSGQVVPYSPVSALSKIAEALLAKKQMEKADLEEKQYNEQRKAQYGEWLKGMPQNGTPEAELAWALGGFNLPGGENVAPIMLSQLEKRQERAASAKEKEADRALKVSEQRQQAEQFAAKLAQEKSDAEARIAILNKQAENTALTAAERAQIEREKLSAEQAWRLADRQQRGDISQAEIGSRERVAGAQIAAKGQEFAATLEQRRAEAQAQADHWAQQLQRADMDAQQRASAEANRIAWERERQRLESESAGARQQAQIGSSERIAGAQLAQQGAIASGQLGLRERQLQAQIEQNQAQLQNAGLDRASRERLNAENLAAQRELETIRQAGAGARQQAQIASTEGIAGARLAQEGAQASAANSLRERQLQAQIEQNSAQLQNASLDRASRERLAQNTAELQRELEGIRQQGAGTRQQAQIASTEGIEGARLTQQSAIAEGQLDLHTQQLQAQIANNQAQLQNAALDRGSRETLAAQTVALQRELEGIRQQGAGARQQAQIQSTEGIEGARLGQQGAIAAGQLGQRERELQAQIAQNQAQMQNHALDRSSRERLSQDTNALQLELEGIRQSGAGTRQAAQIASTEGIAGAQMAQHGAIAGGQLDQRRAELQSQADRAQWELDFRRQEGSLTREHQARLQAQQQAANSELEQMRQAGAGTRQQAQIGAEDARAQAAREQQLQTEEVRLRQQAGQAGAQPPSGMSLLELAQQAGAAQGRAKAAETQRLSDEKRREFDVRMAETQAAGRRQEMTAAETSRHNQAIEAIQRRNSAINEAKAKVLPGGGKAQTPENAGKIASIRQGIKDIDDARAMVLKPGPNGVTFNRALATAAAAPFGGIGGDARKLKSAIYNASDIILRLRTGAAANASEVQKMADTFTPSPLDTSDSAAYKLDRLQAMFNDALALTGNSPDVIGPAKPVRPPPPMPPGAGPAPVAKPKASGLPPGWSVKVK